MRFIFTYIFLVVFFTNCLAQSNKEVTVNLSEPAAVSISKLASQSDALAFIEIISGDAEHFEKVLYKSKVLISIKGIKQSKQIYFGPYIGYGVGSEYIAFLRKSKKTVGEVRLDRAKKISLDFDDSEPVYEIMYGGYSIMPINYVCIFDGKNLSDQCDYGVLFNSYQILIPPTLRPFPLKGRDPANPDNKWIRKNSFQKYLFSLQKSG